MVCGIRRIRTITIILLAVIMALSHSVQSFGATTKLKGVEIPDKYKKGYQVINCLDISRWQKDISPSDWKKIHESGVDAVIIRAGYSSYRSLEHKEDKSFKENIRNASEAGLEVGVYYYSAAVTKEEAVDEAEYFVDLIEPYRDMITLQAVLDFESNRNGRLTYSKMRQIGVDGCTEMCSAFLDVVADAGYDPMIYANRATLDNYLDYQVLQDKYKVWLAQYPRDGSAPTYKGEYYMWQYSSDVRLSGLDVRVDANYIFKEDASATAKIIDIELYDTDDDDQVDEGFTDPADSSTVDFNLGDGVRSEVPISSDADSATVTVEDKSGYTHMYRLYKAEEDNQTETVLATLCSGYFRSSHDIDPEFISSKVLPAVLGDEYTKGTENGKTLTISGIDNVLTNLKLHTQYEQVIDDDIYVNIKSHLAQGKPVIIWAHTNNTKWGANRNQVMLLIGMDEDGNAIMVDPVDRDWSDDDQRVKLVSVTELVDYMKNASDNEDNLTKSNGGGYLLIDR